MAGHYKPIAEKHEKIICGSLEPAGADTFYKVIKPLWQLHPVAK
jgi:hypothetical protein